jgi:excisionase family DNA binding protein
LPLRRVSTKTGGVDRVARHQLFLSYPNYSPGQGREEKKVEKNDPLPKTLLKPSEASAYFGIPLGTIYYWHQAGNIDAINVNGRCLRIFSRSLQQFLASKQMDRGVSGAAVWNGAEARPA